MSKLVDDAADAAPFLPTLMPALKLMAEAMSDPEARGVAERASVALSNLSEECEIAIKGTKKAEDGKVMEAVKKTLGKDASKVPEGTLSHLASMMCSIMSRQKWDEEDWSDVVTYMAVWVGKPAATKAVEELRVVCKEMVKFVPPVDEDDDGGEELCNCQFTLAYGTKILLHNTNMRLKRGNKYGLLGGNDSGKTTLMRAIANGSVGGFPDPSEVRTVFVEADILGELSHLSCIDYILQDPRLSHLPPRRGFGNHGYCRFH